MHLGFTGLYANQGKPYSSPEGFINALKAVFAHHHGLTQLPHPHRSLLPFIHTDHSVVILIGDHIDAKTVCYVFYMNISLFLHVTLCVTGRKLARFRVIWSAKVDISLFLYLFCGRPVGKIRLPEIAL